MRRGFGAVLDTPVEELELSVRSSKLVCGNANIGPSGSGTRRTEDEITKTVISGRRALRRSRQAARTRPGPGHERLFSLEKAAEEAARGRNGCCAKAPRDPFTKERKTMNHKSE